MKEDTITHEGIVSKLTDDEVEIKIVSMSACAACHAKSACNLSDMEEKTLIVPRPKDKDLQLMQKVNVRMSVHQGNKAVVLAYLIPFFILVATVLVLIELGVAEGIAALISLAALVPYYFVLYLCRNKLKSRFSYQIE